VAAPGPDRMTEQTSLAHSELFAKTHAGRFAPVQASPVMNKHESSRRNEPQKSSQVANTGGGGETA